MKLDVDVKIKTDGGADVKLMDEHQLNALVNRSKNKPALKPGKAKLSTQQQKLELKGEMRTTVRNETCGKLSRLVVVNGQLNSPPLLSREALKQLGMMKMQQDGELPKPNRFKWP